MSVTFTPADTVNYATATKTVTLTVSKASPVITWTPAPMVAGDALGDAQLNTSAAYLGVPVAGTYTYSPAAGTVESVVGSRTLSVTFTPTDTARYNTVSSTATVGVKAP